MHPPGKKSPNPNRATIKAHKQHGRWAHTHAHLCAHTRTLFAFVSYIFAKILVGNQSLHTKPRFVRLCTFNSQNAFPEERASHCRCALRRRRDRAAPGHHRCRQVCSNTILEHNIASWGFRSVRVDSTSHVHVCSVPSAESTSTADARVFYIIVQKCACLCINCPAYSTSTIARADARTTPL